MCVEKWLHFLLYVYAACVFLTAPCMVHVCSLRLLVCCMCADLMGQKNVSHAILMSATLLFYLHFGGFALVSWRF